MRVPFEAGKGTDAMPVTYMFQPPGRALASPPFAPQRIAGAEYGGDLETAVEAAGRGVLGDPRDAGSPGATLALAAPRAALETDLAVDTTFPNGAPAPTADDFGDEDTRIAAAPETVQADHPAPAVPTYNLPVKWVPSRSRLILVARSRGGMGATSLAVNLAVELQNRRGFFRSVPQRQVALVDLDVQFGTVGSVLDLDDRGGLLALARLIEEPDTQAVRNALLPHPSGIKVLPAPRTAIPLDALDSQRIGSIVDGLMAEHDYVVVDLPPALVYWLEPLLKRADRLLMVTDLAVPSVISARRVADLMREDNPDLAVEIVVSREQKPLIQRKLHRDAAEALGAPLGHWLPDEAKLSRQALDRGEPLVDFAPRCPWARAVRRLARAIEVSGEASKSAEGKG
jgi:MinD-like ATPase involved in chromosome partitioning or flagellar assembly